jgi:hypothetical protein
MCVKCGGSALCDHGKQHSYCRECNGSAYCDHGKLRKLCRECPDGGGAYCPCGKLKQVCKKCRGNGLCRHERPKAECRVCHPESSRFCKECQHTYASRDKYRPYCVSCFVHKFPEDERSKHACKKYAELKVKAYLTDVFPEVFTHNRMLILGSCDNPHRRLIDFFTVINNVLLAIEVDEHQHRSYDKDDEIQRVNEIFHNLDFSTRMVFIRFNPDGFKVNGKQRRVSMEDRLTELSKVVARTVTDMYNCPETFTDVHKEIKMFFDEPWP